MVVRGGGFITNIRRSSVGEKKNFLGGHKDGGGSHKCASLEAIGPQKGTECAKG